MSYRPSLRGPPIGGQDSDGASYRYSAPYTLSRFAGLRPGGKHVTGFSGRFALLQIQFLCHLKGKREIWREKQRVIYFTYHSGVPPFGGWRHHLSPASGGTITRAYCRAIYEESVSRCFILPPPAGEVRRSRIGGGERSEPISRMLIKSYDTVR